MSKPSWTQGAADPVMPDDLLPDYVKEDGEAVKQGVTYLSADGGEIPNLGQKRIRTKLMRGMTSWRSFR